jgi:hypothetical protein
MSYVGYSMRFIRGDLMDEKMNTEKINTIIEEIDNIIPLVVHDGMGALASCLLYSIREQLLNATQEGN